jgi:UPF0755 protein
MSRDGYEHWDEGPEAQDPAAHDPREGRRSRRATRADEPWPPDSKPSGRGPRHGSHRRSGQDPDAAATDAGYVRPGYGDAGYADSGYGGSGHPDSGYGDAGYGGPGYGESGYGEPGYGSGRAEPGYPGAGFGGPAYGGPAYSEPGYPDARRGDAGYSGSGQAGTRRPDDYGQTDAYGPPDGYGQSGYEQSGYGQSGYGQPGSGESGYGRSAGYPDRGYPDSGADYQNGYRDAGSPANGYRDGGYEPTGTARPAAQDPFASRAPFPPQDDPYATPDPYLRGSAGQTDPRGQTDPFGRTEPRGQTSPRGQADYDDETIGHGNRSGSAYDSPGGYGGVSSYGGQDSYGGPAGHDAADPFASTDARGRRGGADQAGYGPAGYDGQAGYDGPGGSQYGGGYDDHDYSAAAGPDPRERHPAPEPEYLRGDRHDRRVPVDDTGVRRRRDRDPEDELDPDSARHNGFFRGFGAAEDEFGHRPPRRRRSRAGMVALVVLILFVGGLVGGGAYAYHWYSKRHADWTGSAGYGTVLVQVGAGAVACGPLENTLVSDGVVASASAFCSAAKTSGLSSLLQPGEFRLHKHMGAAKAWALIINPKARVQSTLAVPDGMRWSKAIALLAAKTHIPLSQFQAALKNPALGLPSWAKGNPEGFLWPATYNFPPGTSALTILQTMVKQFNTEVTGMNLAAKAKAAQFTEYQVIIAASLLEAEVPPQYYTKVAEVIDNRLNQVPPWDLGLDSTVAYVVNKYIYNLSQSDLNVKSLYNTTKHPGLPPGPIDSPDMAAIQAVLHPAQGGWLYFVTVNKQGTTLFTSSSSQFAIWSQEATRNGV